MPTVTKTAVNIEACCVAKKVIATLPADMKQMAVGVLYAQTVDFMQRANPSGGAAFKGFAGSFEIVPLISDENLGGVPDTTASGNLFLPDTFRQQVETVLTPVLYPDPKKPEKKARGAVEFCALIFLARSENADGYMWGMEFIRLPSVTDPLSSMKNNADIANAIKAKSVPVKAAPETAPKKK